MVLGGKKSTYDECKILRVIPPRRRGCLHSLVVNSAMCMTCLFSRLVSQGTEVRTPYLPVFQPKTSV